MKKLVYITGINRSGTTLLSNILGNLSNIFSVGEFHNIADYHKSSIKNQCTCGININNCKFWTGFSEFAGIDFNTIKTRIFLFELNKLEKSIIAFAKTNNNILFKICNKFSKKFKTTVKIAEANLILLEKISAYTNNDFIIDSSKDPLLAKLYYLLAPKKVIIIRMLRNGYGIFHSQIKRGIDPKTSAYNYKKVMINSEVYFKNISNNIVYRVHYEDLCSITEQTITNILEKLEIKTDDQVKPQEINRRERHDVGGSPSINKVNLEIMDIQLDEKWRESLDPSYKKYFNDIAGKVQIKYGYSIEDE